MSGYANNHSFWHLYKSQSIKAAEFNVSGSWKVHKFREFLKSSKNRQRLQKFLTEYIICNGIEFLQDNEILIISGGFEKVMSKSKCRSVQTLDCLYSDQEEADTRIILHVAYESRFSQQILVKSVDTDVLILLVHFYTSVPDLNKITLHVQLEHSTNKRFISVDKIVYNLGKSICSCLLSIHCLTGCDTTSAFYKIWKRTAFDVLRKNVHCLEKLSKLPLLPEQEALKRVIKYILLFYKNKATGIGTLNNLRLRMATKSNKPSPSFPQVMGFTNIFCS